MSKRSTKMFTIEVTLTVPGDKNDKDINWWVDRIFNNHKGDNLTHNIKEESPLKVINLGVQKDPLLQNMHMHKKLIKMALKEFPHEIKVSGKIQQYWNGPKYVSIYLNTEGKHPNFVCFNVLPEYYEVFYDDNHCISDRYHQIRYSDADLLVLLYDCVMECYGKCKKVTK